jgi:hypothetical protein
MNLATLRSLAPVIETYVALRQARPEMPARSVLAHVRGDIAEARTLDQTHCAITAGHRWSYTGTAYGGDDESYHGEGRCYCCYCGIDGDA